MSLQPKLIITEDLATLTMALQVKKAELTITRDAAAERLNTIELVMKENEILEAKTREQVSESVNLFLEEWSKLKELYPEVRFGILQKAAEFLTPEDKKKK